MTIALLNKLTLIGAVDAKAEILEAVQRLGAIHLVALAEHQSNYLQSEYEQLKEALMFLKAAPNKRRLQRPKADYDVSAVVSQILVNKIAREDVLDQVELICLRIKELKPWGDFEYSALSDLNEHRLWFYKIPLSKKTLLASLNLPWQIISEDHKVCYLLVVAEQEPSAEQVPFGRIHVGNLSLSELEEAHEKALVQLEDLNAQRESLTRWILPLTQSLDEAVDNAEKLKASEMALHVGTCFVMQGWIPESKLPALEQLRQQLPLAYQCEEAEASDEPPTLLQNSTRFGGGEEAVSFFQLPGYRSWDPSLMIFFSFSLFFAMILADAGYALLLAAFIGAFWKKLSRRETSIRIRNLMTAMIGASLAYGVMVGSYFGATPSEGSLLGYLHVLDMNNYGAMMKLSIGAGVLHLLLANAMVAWTDRQSLRVLASVGWISVIGSGFLLWLEYLSSESFSFSGSSNTQLLLAGLVLILLFTSSHKITRLADLWVRLFEGLTALYGLSKAFGDVLSYMRLFALGLSSASLAVTFNHLAVEARDSVSAGGVLLFVLILLLGHGLNFVLGVMSGVIHGLRLNLLEFYNWGVKGEGYPFSAFEKRKRR